MPTLFFYLFSILAIAGAIALVAFKNPVSSALSMVVSFVGLAALFILLNAYFVGIVQILVYAGAIMVLFLFIIMLLDLKEEETRKFKAPAIAAGIVVPLLFIVQVYAVLDISGNQQFEELDYAKASAVHAIEGLEGSKGSISDSLDAGQLPDTKLIGHTLFGSDKGEIKQGFNFPIQIIGILLLVSTVGVVVLSKKGDAPATPRDTQA